MKWYIEITLLPGPEIPLYFLWSKVYQQVHLALAETNENRIAVSFPRYQCNENQRHLGDKLRLFSVDRTQLENLNMSQKMKHLLDYIHQTAIRPVPDELTGYTIFKRHQTKSNNQRMARRLAKRSAKSFQKAEEHYNGRQEEYSLAPYIRMSSSSTGEHFPLFIVRELINSPGENEKPNSYGLGKAVPVF